MGWEWSVGGEECICEGVGSEEHVAMYVILLVQVSLTCHSNYANHFNISD